MARQINITLPTMMETLTKEIDGWMKSLKSALITMCESMAITLNGIAGHLREEREEFEMTTSGITNINAKLIHQHPDNPRKDLGDLTELSESIKKKGIMQNLTVIPGHWDENRAHHDEGYTLIIGHRRFAAGKMAGVTMYPCRIVEDMSYKDQVGTMLEENMQRIDLTPLEQAEGFQMMLDLGDTEEQIAEKTGFSRTTVHRRLEIAKLDRDLVKEKTDENGAYQLTLKDLARTVENRRR